jgi:hypothetical protein
MHCQASALMQVKPTADRATRGETAMAALSHPTMRGRQMANH